MFHFFKKSGIIFLVIMICCSSAWAIDYTALTNDELNGLKEAIKNAPEEEQQAYRKECQARFGNTSFGEIKKNQNESDVSDKSELTPDQSRKSPYIQFQGYESQSTTRNFDSVVPGLGSGDKERNNKD